jgi:hypothetical protein
MAKSVHVSIVAIGDGYSSIPSEETEQLDMKVAMILFFAKAPP